MCSLYRHYVISSSDGSLTLNNVSAEDEGQYRCAYEVGEGVYLYSNSAQLTNQAGYSVITT